MPTITTTPYTSPYPSTIIALSRNETFYPANKRLNGRKINTITVVPPQWGPLSPVDGTQPLLQPASFTLQGTTPAGRLYTDPRQYLLGDIPAVLPRSSHLQGLVSQILTSYIADPPPRLSPHAAHGLTPRPRTLLQHLLPSKKARGL